MPPKKAYTDAFQQPQGDDSSTVTEQLYGKVNVPDSGRQVAQPISLAEIKTDPRQPRREIPLLVRQSVARDPGIEPKDKDRTSVLIKRWVEMAATAANTTLDIYDLLKSIGEGAETDRSEIALYDDLMALVALASSIWREGLINPITVVNRAPKLNFIETGERRFLAHVLLFVYLPKEIGSKYDKIPARVVTEGNVWRQAVENASRKPLNAIGMARQLSLLIMDLYNGVDGIQFAKFEDLVLPGESDRPFYAQIANGQIYRVPKGQGEKILQATGLKSISQLAHYRNLLNIPDEMWMTADAENWTEFKIRTTINPPKETDTFTAVNVSPQNSPFPPALPASPFARSLPQNPPSSPVPPAFTPLSVDGEGQGVRLGEVGAVGTGLALSASEVGLQNEPSLMPAFRIGDRVLVDGGPDTGTIVGISGSKYTVSLPTTASNTGMYRLTIDAPRLSLAQPNQIPPASLTNGWIGETVRHGGKHGVVQEITRMRLTPTGPIQDALVIKSVNSEDTWFADPLKVERQSTAAEAHSYKIGDRVRVIGGEIIGEICQIIGDRLCVLSSDPKGESIRRWYKPSLIELIPVQDEPSHVVRSGNNSFSIHQTVDIAAGEYTGRTGQIVRLHLITASIQLPNSEGKDFIVELPYSILLPSVQTYEIAQNMAQIFGYEGPTTDDDESPLPEIGEGLGVGLVGEVGQGAVSEDLADYVAGYDENLHGDMTQEEYADRQRSLALLQQAELEMAQTRGYGQFSNIPVINDTQFVAARAFIEFCKKYADTETVKAQSGHLLNLSPEEIRASLEAATPAQVSAYLQQQKTLLFEFMERVIITNLDQWITEVETRTDDIYTRFFKRG